jgi:hypothetical protein
LAPQPPYQPNVRGRSGTRVVASFTFNGSGSVAVTIYRWYSIAEDEV